MDTSRIELIRDTATIMPHTIGSIITEGEEASLNIEGEIFPVNAACTLGPHDLVEKYASTDKNISLKKIIATAASNCIICQKAGRFCPSTALPQAINAEGLFADSISIKV